MKKITLLALAALFGLPGLAQTNFRDLTYDEAIATAKAENKLVFMDFYTDWCGPCKRMMSDVFPLKSVGDYMNAKFVCIKINAEKEGKELADIYKITAYPTFIAIDTDKKIVLTKVGMAQADDFIAQIDRMLDPDRSPARMKERYESGERTPELISSYAAWIVEDAYENHGGEQETKKAFQMVQDYFKGLSEADRLAPANLFIYEKYAQKATDETIRFMAAHRKDFPQASQATVEQVLGKLYHYQLYGYLTATEEYDAATYEMIKREVNEQGFNKDGSYDLVFRLIECHAKGDLNAYLDLCEQIYDQLSEETKGALMGNMSHLIQTDDATVRQRASKFVRSKLADMEVTQMYFTVYDLMQLEKKL